MPSTAETQTTTHPGLPLPVPQRYWAALTIAIAIVMSVLDGTIINIALPAIARDLQVSPASVVWVTNAYQLTVAVCLLPLASLASTVGYRRVYMTGLAVFTAASFVCANAGSLETLVAGRVLQAFGAAGIFSVNAALVRFIYPPNQLGRGIGINAMVVATAGALGPTIAAGILAIAPWPWLFAINVPLGLIALGLALRTLPTTPRSPHRFDFVSAVLNVLAMGLLILAIDSLSGGLGRTALMLGGAVIFGTLMVRRQLARPAPLFPVDLLRIPIFALSVSSSVLAFAAQMLAFVSLPFYLQNVLDRTQVETGLLLTPWPVALVIIAPIAGRLADRHSAGLLGGIGMAVFGVGLVALALLPASPSDLDIIWRMALCGLGFGLFQSPNNRTIMGSAPRHRSGGASGMLGTARLLGHSLGTAMVALIFSLQQHAGAVLPLSIAAVCALGALITSALKIRTPMPEA